MIASMQANSGQRMGRKFPVALVLVYAVIFFAALRTYIIWQSVNLLLGLVILPMVTTTNDARRGSYRFAVFAVVAVVLGWLLPVKTMLFVSMLFAVLFAIETFYGRLNQLPVLVCLLISPFVQYLVALFSFPIRLWLSQLAGQLLTIIGDTVIVSGNIIDYAGHSFSVDPACMGLNMMATSLLLGIVLTGIYQKRLQQTVSFTWLAVLLTVVFALNIVSNLFRILIIVKFSILPANVMHEVTGIACLVLYVALPAMVLSRFFVKRFGKAVTHVVPQVTTPPAKLVWHLCLVAAVGLLALRVDQKPQPLLVVPQQITQLPGAVIESAGGNITKIRTSDVLIYVKPISNFYDGEHNPSICWKGSGYEMQKINTMKMGGTVINTGELRKGNDVLFTAWWFDNGQVQTVSQFDWRWQMFKGSKPFAIFNVTAASEAGLRLQVRQFFAKKINRQLLVSAL